MRLALLLLAFVLSGCASLGAGAGLVSVEVRSESLPLDSGPHERSGLGSLEYRGGLRLESPARAFGGWSGLAVSENGAELVAISDEAGAWLEARLAYDGAGRLAGMSRARLGVLRDLEGRPLRDKQDSDAESLVRLPGGGWLVGFEHHHRLWLYPARRSGLGRGAREFEAPIELQRAPPNGGLEAVARLADGRLLALSEELAEGRARVGWLGGPGAWERLFYEPAPDFAPSDATTLPGGDVLVLERAYSPKLGPRARLVRVAETQIVPGAHLSGELLGELRRPQLVDNFEGVAARRGAHGETLVYLLSDDNFDHENQRTLLLLFALQS